jgi:flagellar hook-length control protein FliK
MTALAFDTLKFAQTLRDKAKFTQEQSEGLAIAIADATSDQLATKADIKDLRVELRNDMREMEMRLDAKIDSLRIDGLKWIIGAVGFQTLVMIGTILSVMRFGVH